MVSTRPNLSYRQFYHHHHHLNRFYIHKPKKIGFVFFGFFFEILIRCKKNRELIIIIENFLKERNWPKSLIGAMLYLIIFFVTIIIILK